MVIAVQNFVVMNGNMKVWLWLWQHHSLVSLMHKNYLVKVNNKYLCYRTFVIWRRFLVQMLSSGSSKGMQS